MIHSKYPFTYTYENIFFLTFYKDPGKNNKRMKEGRHIFKTDDSDYIARRTYLVSCRFMRLKDLFDNETQHIFQLDCDNPFYEMAFIKITSVN